jgi:hypothetical protein
MNRPAAFILILLFTTGFASRAVAQDRADSLTDEIKAGIFNKLRHFTLGFYVDSYVTMELGTRQDTTNIVPYFANCPMTDQIRLNVAAFELFYDAEKIRGKLQLHFGDAPNLLAAPEKQWIKNIRQAAVGFRVTKKLWADVGFMFTPIGCESTWPVINTISTISMCAYFEPGAVMGIKFTYQVNDRLTAGFMFGNPYSIAYQQTNHLAGILFVSYTPVKNLTLAYNNMFGNQALRDAKIKNNLLYNDILVVYDPHRSVNLTGQFDFAFQTNSGMSPDTNKIASMCSGWIQCRYSFLKYFSIAGRYEYCHDPEGFLSGPYTYDRKTTGLSMNGTSLSLEFKPVRIAYIRMEYKYMHANSGNKVYYSGTSDHLNALIFTAGIRF